MSEKDKLNEVKKEEKNQKEKTRERRIRQSIERSLCSRRKNETQVQIFLSHHLSPYQKTQVLNRGLFRGKESSHNRVNNVKGSKNPEWQALLQMGSGRR
jgi:hypothetical protein